MLVRAATVDDLAFLRRMWHMAAFWQPDVLSLEMDQALGVDEIARYIDGWGRPGDAGVIAEVDGSAAGAAWVRLFTPDRPGYGFVDGSTPELAIAVEPDHRRRGIATALLAAAADQARDAGHPAVSLSVDGRNPSRRIYQRCGFVDVASEDGAFVMVLEL